MADEERQENENEQPEDAPEEESSNGDPAAPGSEAEEAAGSDVSGGDDSGEEAGEAGDAAGSDVEPEDPEDTHPKAVRKRLRAQAPAEPKPQRSPEERAAERAERRREATDRRRRYRHGRRGKRGEPGTGTPPAEREGVARRERQGTVVSSRGDKTITVQVELVGRHRRYEKVVRRTRTLHVHDEGNQAGEGDIVRVVETRPLSKTKRWRLAEILERAR